MSEFVDVSVNELVALLTALDDQHGMYPPLRHFDKHRRDNERLQDKLLNVCEFWQGRVDRDAPMLRIGPAEY